MNEDVRKAIKSIAGHLGDLQGEVRANSHDIKKIRAELTEGFDRMGNRMDSMDAHLTEIRGSFASIGRLLEQALDDDDRKRLADLEARVAALEGKKKAS